MVPRVVFGLSGMHEHMRAGRDGCRYCHSNPPIPPPSPPFPPTFSCLQVWTRTAAGSSTTPSSWRRRWISSGAWSLTSARANIERPPRKMGEPKGWGSKLLTLPFVRNNKQGLR